MGMIQININILVSTMVCWPSDPQNVFDVTVHGFLYLFMMFVFCCVYNDDISFFGFKISVMFDYLSCFIFVQ